MDLKRSLIKREAFFTNPELLSNDKSKLPKKYRIGQIEYNPDIHWIIYNFKTNEIFEKSTDRLQLMFNFQNNTYKDISGNDIKFDMKEYIATNKSKVILECFLPNDKAIFAIFDDKIYTPLNFDCLYYNLLHTTINKKIYNVLPSDMEKIENTIIKKFHWVWFRRPGSVLNIKIIKRASSWIQLNPDIEFHLWTNLEQEQDGIDFLKDVSEYLPIINKIKIHYKSDTYNIVNTFFKEQFTDDIEYYIKWTTYKDILDNEEDTSAMIFKTDIVRLIILHQIGGWYSDFNDTYAFIPLKYLINPDISLKKITEYHPTILGSDFLDICNNYFLYNSPNTSEGTYQFLKSILQIINNSLSIYRILSEKDFNIYDIIQFMFREFITTLIKNPYKEKTFFDIIKYYIYNWTHGYNTTIKKYLIENNIHVNNHMQLNDNFILLYFKYITLSIKPGSEIIKQFDYEINKIKSIPSISKPTIQWKQQLEIDFKLSESEINFWADFLLNNTLPNKNTVFNILVRANIANIINMTNIGAIYNSLNISKNKYIIPYCHIPNNFTFLTAIGHLGDGTSCGDNYENTQSINLI